MVAHGFMFDADSSRRAKADRAAKAFVSLFFGACVFLSIGFAAQLDWKTFFNRAGWSMNYPAHWKIASCHTCSDPAAPDVYVDFSPPDRREPGTVTVEPLAQQPPTMTLDQWFADVKSSSNQNPQLAQKRFTLNGLPALRVRYRIPSGTGYEIETVYVVCRRRTFAIEFDPQRGGIPLEASGNYPSYLEMVKTFKIKPSRFGG